ncbi:hypothetical protein [Aeribacillus pallidus]|jgi:hypothetical protein
MFKRLFIIKENNDACCDVQIVEVNDKEQQESCCEDNCCVECC